MLIRNAHLDDALSIAKVHVDSWKSTYKGIISDEFLNLITYEKRQQLWEQNINNNKYYIFVAEDIKQGIVGYAVGHMFNDRYGEISSIYILDPFHGKGIGKQLLKVIFERLAQHECQTVFVKVLEENKSRYFYEHLGAVLHESTDVIIGDQSYIELIYVWRPLDEILIRL